MNVQPDSNASIPEGGQQITLSDEEVKVAAQQEENEKFSAEVARLSNRNVMLRALVNRLQAEINDLKQPTVESDSVQETVKE